VPVKAPAVIHPQKVSAVDGRDSCHLNRPRHHLFAIIVLAIIVLAIIVFAIIVAVVVIAVVVIADIIIADVVIADIIVAVVGHRQYSSSPCIIAVIIIMIRVAVEGSVVGDGHRVLVGSTVLSGEGV